MAAVSQRLVVINFLFSGRLPQIALLLLQQLSFVPSSSCLKWETFLFRVSQRYVFLSHCTWSSRAENVSLNLCDLHAVLFGLLVFCTSFFVCWEGWVRQCLLFLPQFHNPSKLISSGIQPALATSCIWSSLGLGLSDYLYSRSERFLFACKWWEIAWCLFSADAIFDISVPWNGMLYHW